MSLLMHAICYTHLIFIMLSHFLHYQNLSTEIKTPSLLLLLSCNISLNSGPPHMDHPSGSNEWDVFKARGLQFTHININCLLLKIEELCCIVCLSSAVLNGISESKLDNSIFDLEIEIDGYMSFDRNGRGGGVTLKLFL